MCFANISSTIIVNQCHYLVSTFIFYRDIAYYIISPTIVSKDNTINNISYKNTLLSYYFINITNNY